MKPFPVHPYGFSIPRLLISKQLEVFQTSINLKEIHAKFILEQYKYFDPFYLQIKKHDTYTWNLSISVNKKNINILNNSHQSTTQTLKIKIDLATSQTSLQNEFHQQRLSNYDRNRRINVIRLCYFTGISETELIFKKCLF